MIFRRNITITIACIMTEFLLCLIPTIFMIYIFFIPDKINEIFSTLLIVPYFILIINAILIIISLISQIFIKTKFYLNKETLIVKEKEKSKEIHYNEIANITYDFGDLTKFNGAPSQATLFDKEFKQILLIKNPSIIMVHLLKKRCKNAKMSYKHNKRFLFFLTLINGIFLLTMIGIKIF